MQRRRRGRSCGSHPTPCGTCTIFAANEFPSGRGGLRHRRPHVPRTKTYRTDERSSKTGRRACRRSVVFRLQGVPHAGRTAHQRAGCALRTDRGLRPARMAGCAGRYTAQHSDRTRRGTQPARTALRRVTRAAERIRESRHASPQRIAGTRSTRRSKSRQRPCSTTSMPSRRSS